MKNFKNILKNFFIVCGILSMIYLLIYTTLHIGTKRTDEGEVSKETLKYAEFLAKINNEEISLVKYNPSFNEFEVVTTLDETFKVTNPKYPEFKKFLLESGILVEEASTPVSDMMLRFLLEALIMMVPIFVIIYFFRSVMPKNKSKKETVSTTSNTKFSDIAGHDETKTDMILLVDFLKNPKKYQTLGAKLPKGVLLHGPPGTGKTLFAKAIAGEANVPFFNTNASEFVEMYVGVGASRVRELFKEARAKAPCVIFIDELEALAKKSSMDNSEKEQTLKQFLVELDGFHESSGILVIGATNHLSSLDETFTRSGRFDRHITIGLPDLHDRREIILYHANGKKFSKDVDFDNLAKISASFSGADIAKVLNEAAIRASINNKKEIDSEDLEEAFYRTVMKGYQKTNINRDQEESRIVAYHEAGHAIVAKFLANRNVPKVSIISSTSGAGGVTFINNEKENLLSKEDLMNDVKIAYAGRIAELLLFNDENKITTGASSDIDMATKKLYTMVKIFGMSNFGMINLEVINSGSEKILEEISKMSEKLYSETLNYLKENKKLLDALAHELIAHETLNEKELEVLGDKFLNVKNQTELAS
jgi:cell division protease FtsH